MPPSSGTVEDEVSDASTSAARLAEIAHVHPELHSAILAHPSIYEGLREWIENAAASNETVEPSKPLAVALDSGESSAEIPRARSGPWTTARAVLAALAVVIVVVIGCSIGFAVKTTAHSVPYDSYYDSSEPTQLQENGLADDSGSVVESAPEATRDPRIPVTCDGLFSPSMRAQIESAGLVLNPSRVSGADYRGTADPTLASYINNPLVCAWVSPNSDTGASLITTISAIGQGDQQAIQKRLADYTPVDSDQLGGHRYVIDLGTSGESHLLREGLWFATVWSTVGPDGYTADLVAHVFG